jgi:hypothetical protein
LNSLVVGNILTFAGHLYSRTIKHFIKGAIVIESYLSKHEYALTVLARMIVRAYLGEIDRGEAGPNAFKNVGTVKRHNKRSNLDQGNNNE